MAEFKLGRIRFVWKDHWVTGTTYYKDDVVRYAGKTYICQIGHAGALDFNTDLDINPTKWDLMSDGQRWTGDWTTAQPYEEGDLVKYGGTVYVCTNGHTSAATAALGLEDNSADWNQFAEGTDWKDIWTVSTRYKLNDVVRYGGINYVCITGHTSAATASLGLEANIGDWQVFSQGQEYQGTWTTLARYKLNDVVKYGAGLWICTTQHSAGATFAGDAANWAQYVEGFEFENAWNEATAYQPGDVVRYGGNNYVAKTQNTNSNPLVGTADWDLFSEGLSYRDEWTNTVSYKIGEVVKLNGYNYLAIADSPSNSYAITAVDGVTERFATVNTAGMVAGMSVRFTGTTFGGIFTTARYYVKQVISSTEFTISTTIGGAVFNASTAAGTMTASVSAEPPNSSYWSAVSHGIYWRSDWTDDAEYNVGDTVKYAANSYICVLAHRSEGDDGSTVGIQGGGQALSRPDLDVTGTYWNVLTIGNELSVLTTVGDMVYQGGAGPTRLPVGTEGQVLRVSSAGIPEWVTWGQIENVYYVAPSGEDRPYPDCGASLDKPWKTIRYAAEQVEQGPRNPDAQYLLELNRAFIQREVTSWINAQVLEFTTTNPDPTSIWYNLSYLEAKCARDAGFIIDRLIWDIGHGGNLKVRAAAFSLLGAFGEAGEFSAAEEDTSYVTLPAEAEVGIAAYTYMLEVVDAVLNNTEPMALYQTTEIVTQYVDTDYVAETGVFADVTELVGIVITALTDLETANLPARRVPNNTINIKTGQYRETLPIIVAAETALVGDEKRSVNAGPAGSVTSKDDASYSIGALSRLETVVGQLILGTNVAETAGNIETQSSAFPFASALEVTDIQRLVRTMQHQIDFRIGTNTLETVTDPVGYNVGFLAGYKSARTLLRENKDFLKDEIIAYIAVNYPNVKYSKTKFRRDIGFIVDAVCYDLTYGGKYQTLTAGLAYFDGNNSTDLQIDSTEIAATADSYSRLTTVMQQIIANTVVTVSTGNAATQWTDATYLTGGSNANTAVGSLINIIINIIQGDSTASLTPQINITTIATNNTFTSAAHGMLVGDAVVPRTTAQGLTAGVKYWVSAVATNTFSLSATYGGATLTSFSNGTGLDLDFEVIDYATATNAVTSTTALITAAQTLDAAQETIVTNATSFITTTYPTLVYDSAKCERDVRLILEAVMFDFMFNSNSLTRTAAYSYLRASASDVFSLNQKTATRAAFSYVRTQALANVGGNVTAQARITALMTTLDDIVYGATNEGSICQTEISTADHARLQLERNRTYIAAEISAYIGATYTTTVTTASSSTNLFTCTDTSWMQRNAAIQFTGTVFGGISAGTVYYIQNVVSSTTFKISTTRNSNTSFSPLIISPTGSMTISLYYDSAAYMHDVGTYIDALKFDLQYPGNYKSRLAARYYANAVTGSLEEDMFYLRNGTGVRNMTLQGLTGDLLAPNAFGTSRVSAGAYCSLDPGWGPDDFRAWIIGRSPYVQNVATFGYAAIGQKIDGALHNGGNNSIVSNDFTQIISDGIGAWVTNNGRAELVSVFSYYAHIGYLSENGGRIRGTNGNNSYGDFGSVAEGFDATETPILCEVDNTAFNATVGSVITDGIDRIWQLEYNNAGSDYTEVSWTISGGGGGVVTEQDDFRDGAVYQVRLIDNVDDSTTAPESDGNAGGIGYISNANTAQIGTTSSLTLSAVDDEISGAYVGMKLIVTAGAGVGQVGIVTTYTAGTKVATVTKESTGGAGWDHLVPGTAIVAPDASSTYLVEPRVSFTAPTYSSASRTLASAQTYTAAAYAPVFAVYTPVTATGGAGASATFTVARKGTKYSAVNILAAGTGYARLNTLTLAGTSLGGISTNNITVTVTAVNATTGAIVAFEFTGVGAGGNFVAVASGSRDVNYSTNGTTWSSAATALPSTSLWNSVAAGKLTAIETAGSFVTGRSYIITSLGNTVFTSIGASANLVGTYFVATGTGGSTTGTATPVASHLVAVSSSTTVNAYSANGGVTWASGGALPGGISGTAVRIAYGRYANNARWMVLGSTGASAYSNNGGVSWIAGGSVGSGTFTNLVYGQGVFIAIATGATTTRRSTDGGQTWTAGGALPATSTWTSIAYGKNIFVAVSSDGAVSPAYSVNSGVTWSSIGIAGWLNQTVTAVRYGQGIFAATNSTSNNMVSSEDGINWTTRAITRATGTGARIAVQGNPSQSGIWTVIPSASTTAASSAVLGTTAKARAFVASNKIFAIRVTDPGSAYSAAPAITITDPNNLFEAPTQIRTGNGALANVSFVNRGTGFDSAFVEQDSGDGFADNFQDGKFVGVRRLTGIPRAGANVVFATQPDVVYKLVQVLSESGTADGARSAFFQLSPTMSVFNAPPTATGITTRIRYSQVRLTGHDFLDIGTGNFVETNYPGIPLQVTVPANETVDNNGGRVFYTSTDQDGNFRVGSLFSIEQSTGVATLNADAFNIAGLSELSLGNITLGGNSATITEFSTDPFLTANSDNVVATQRAIRSYISAQIGGGGASLNVNSLVAGFIEIAGTRITTTTGGTIQMKANFNFQAGVRGYPVAWNYFLNN